MSKNPLDLVGSDERFSKELIAQALRLGIIAELDAINLYLQLAERITDGVVRETFLEIAREEKAHVGEFLALLKKIDPEQAKELEAGAREVAEKESQ